MRSILSFILVILAVQNAYCQKLDSIKYDIPDIVKSTITSYISSRDAAKTYYAVIGSYDDTTSVLVSTDDKNIRELTYLIQNSNRYVELSKHLTIPVIFQTDLQFSTQLHYVINSGKENEAYRNNDIMISGYLIDFTGRSNNATITRKMYFQY